MSPAALLLVAAVPAALGTPRARATAAKTEVTVGETFVVEVTAEGPAGTLFSFPPDAGDDRVELWTVPGAQPLPPAQHRYQALVLTLGEAEVPGIAVRYRLPTGSEGEISTAPVPLRVLSLLPKDPKEQKLAEIRGPLPLSIGRAFWIAVALALVALAGLTAWLWSRRRRRERPAVAAPPLAPYQEALQSLDSLAASGFLARGEHRAFYITLTAIAKRYLERRLKAPVLEMTSAEMMAFLRQGPFEADLLPALKDLSRAADQIKFALGRGLPAEGDRHLAAILDLVRRLETRLQPPPAEEAA
ncbi:MAG TPA: hypothetical protein VN461_18100 [Vicinamibacteria bacterium]|nr:hypothetical protein [Vicinamibacteria bacterium]